MKVKRALRLKKGDRVPYPADAWSKKCASVGTVKQDCAGSGISTDLNGIEYIWVSLGPFAGVWPSNRL